MPSKPDYKTCTTFINLETLLKPVLLSKKNYFQIIGLSCLPILLLPLVLQSPSELRGIDPNAVFGGNNEAASGQQSDASETMTSHHDASETMTSQNYKKWLTSSFRSFVQVNILSEITIAYHSNLNTRLVRHLNGRFVSGCQRVQYSNGGLKTGLKKPVYGPKCPVFEWSAKSGDYYYVREVAHIQVVVV